MPPIQIYTPVGYTIEPPFIWYIQKCMLIWEIFLKHFCLRYLFVKNEDAPCYSRPIHGKGALALGQFQHARSFHILWLHGNKESTRSESSVIIVYEISRELKMSERESTFSVKTYRECQEKLIRICLVVLELMTNTHEDHSLCWNSKLTKRYLLSVHCRAMYMCT